MAALSVLVVVVQVYTFVLLARVIIEMIQSFSRQWRPSKAFSVIAEPLFVVTNPPVRLGGVALDVSVLVLFFILQIVLRILVSVLAG
ncbi:YggT family protein [Corynebacterium bovis]|uniref:YggT family protein n=1 Tax=Corynebacterium bovis TaxID=36808 RepID=UPI003138966A